MSIKASIVKREDGSCDIFYSNGARISLLEDSIHFRKLSSWELLQIVIPLSSSDDFAQVMTCPLESLDSLDSNTLTLEQLDSLKSKRREWLGTVSIEA